LIACLRPALSCPDLNFYATACTCCQYHVTTVLQCWQHCSPVRPPIPAPALTMDCSADTSWRLAVSAACSASFSARSSGSSAASARRVATWPRSSPAWEAAACSCACSACRPARSAVCDRQGQHGSQRSV
jgi:hypothetical protein